MVTLVCFVLGASWVLDAAFGASVERSAASQLQVHVYALLASAENAAGRASGDSAKLVDNAKLVEALEKSRLNRTDSSLYGYVIDEKGQPIWRSTSALLIDPPPLKPLPQGSTRFSSVEVGDEDYYVYGLGTFWETRARTRQFTFVVMESQANYRATIAAFRSTLSYWLLGLTVALCLIVYVVTRWGLLPLERLKAQLARMQSGEEDQVAGQYPREIQQVVDHLNTLLAYERKQREKYKNSLADLAHSLKTPLAVMQNASQLDDSQLRTLVDEQTHQMNVIVQQQLRRAINKGTALWSKGVSARPVLDRIRAALHKGYAHKGKSCEIISEGTVRFPREEAALYEVAGNLLENAYKYGGPNIWVTLSENENDVGGFFRIIVEDDGEGIPAWQKRVVFERGARLDSSMPGQGIGLAMVAELVNDLGGTIRLEYSVKGGARFVVEVPA
ncbi:Signal transduction histidine kinase [gamma proteobacterium HdN1]|nr:Signal transduction histidine kinase [gamma proteobacterium HdN1]